MHTSNIHSSAPIVGLEVGPTPDSIDVDASGWVIRYPDGAYNSGAGNANGFPVRYAEATIYETRREAEIKAEDLGDVEILAVPRAKPITEFSSEWHRRWRESAGTPGFCSNLRKPLTVEQCETLERQLKREDLQIFTVVRMAQKDLAKGDLDMVLCRLRMDADKLRDEKELYAIIRYYF